VPHWVLPILASPFIGSFLGLVVKRLPAGENMVSARSRCDHCGAPLAVQDLVPLASWARTRGRCRQCGARLGWFYPAIEGAAILVALAAAGVDWDDPTALWLDCVLGWALLALAWIDVEHLLLPDLITLPLVLLGLAATLWQEPENVTDHAIAAAAGYLLFRAIALVYQRIRGKEGLGEGDAKLLAAAGAWLGLLALSWMILVAAVIALLGVGIAILVGKSLDRATALPFGAALAAALFVLRLCNLGDG